jgi:ribosomal-protein-alanine N-acetyltransferase
MERGQLVKLWLCKTEEPDRVIGSVAISNIVRGVFLSCHLGYRLDEAEQGKGYMTEAIREMVAYAFQKLGLHRIEANIMPRNTASLKVTEKLGFYHEGLAKQYLRINGKWEDHIHMVLLNEEME